MPPADSSILGVMALIVLAGCLASCAIFRPTASWIEVGEERDVGPLTEAIVSLVVENLSQPSAPIALVPPPPEQNGHLLTLQLREALTNRGFRLDDEGTENVHSLRYLVSSYQGGILLRVTLDGTEASTLFTRDSAGALRAAAPLALRQKGKGAG